MLNREKQTETQRNIEKRKETKTNTEEQGRTSRNTLKWKEEDMEMQSQSCRGDGGEGALQSVPQALEEAAVGSPGRPLDPDDACLDPIELAQKPEIEELRTMIALNEGATQDSASAEQPLRREPDGDPSVGVG